LEGNVKDVLNKIPKHIYKNLMKGAYERECKYVRINQQGEEIQKIINSRRFKCSKM